MYMGWGLVLYFFFLKKSKKQFKKKKGVNSSINNCVFVRQNIISLQLKIHMKIRYFKYKCNKLNFSQQ
jgi:hypothetical protein